MNIRVDDQVEVITGDDKIRGKVLKVLASKNKVLVEGVNRVFKHVQRSQRNPQGGRLQKEMPISISNVKLICPTCGQPTRVGVKYEQDGTKVRVCKQKSCQATISVLSPPRPRYAAK